MAAIDFLTMDDILVAHLDQTQRYGGDPGLRDVGLLESAVAQPRAAFNVEVTGLRGFSRRSGGLQS